MSNCNFAGYLACYGIVSKDGTVKETWLEKPIHNRIVKTGINQLLTYNGDNSGGLYIVDDNLFPTVNYPVYLGSYTNGGRIHYGCLAFCQLGTSNVDTDYFDTELKEPFGSKTSTLKTDTNEKYTGTICTDAYHYTINVTHNFGERAEDVDIKEIGYFGGYTNDKNDEGSMHYTMFARIKLDETIKLKAGEQFYCTYKLNITFSDQIEQIDNFGGIENQSCRYKFSPYFTDTFKGKSINTICGYSDGGCLQSFISCPSIFNQGTTYYPHGHNVNSYRSPNCRYFCFPQIYYKRESYNSIKTNENVLLTTEPKDFNANTNIDITYYTNTQFSKYRSTYDFVDYDPDTNYRDIKIILPVYCPNLSMEEGNQQIEIHNILCRGYEYKMGYYDEDSHWVAQPIIKKVNQEMTFTVRTTITTDDTAEYYDETGHLKTV